MASPSTIGVGCLLALCYAAPLLLPLPPIPATLTTLRLLALVGAALLLSRPLDTITPLRVEPPVAARRWAALGVALGLAALAARGSALSAAGQVAFLIALFAPALLLVMTSRPAPARRTWLPAIVPAAVVILGWLSLRVLVDAHSARAAHAIDTWRTALGIATFLDGPGNYVTDGIDPEMPGVPATALVALGVPLVQAGIVPLDFAAIRMMHLVSLVVTAIAVGLTARRLLGAGATVAMAVFLFAPLTCSMALSAGPYAVSSAWAAMVMLCAVAAWQRGSEAVLAALGALCGLAVVHPGLVPTAIVGVAIGTVSLRGGRPVPWVTAATATTTFIAAAWPHAANAFGRTFDAARSVLDGHLTTTIGPVLLSPFVVGRAPGRLWGDTLFDPVGAVLLSIGVVSCARSLRRTPAAVIPLLFLAAALLPALVASAEHPIVLRAFGLAVPGALLAAAGFQALRPALGTHAVPALAVVAAVCVTGTIVFDLVNPRILGSSALATMFRSLDDESARRAVLVDDASELGPDVRRLARGPMTAIDGERPIAYLRYGNGALPDLPADGIDLLFWSPEVERRVLVSDVVCSQWPGAMLYRIGDGAREGIVLAARLGTAPWRPASGAHVRRADRCTTAPRGAG